MNEMAKDATRNGLLVLTAALALGVLGDALLRTAPPGLNVFLWIGALAGVYLALRRLNALPAAGQGRWLLLPALLLAAGFLWRDSPALQLLDVLGLAVLLGLASAYSRGGDLRRGHILDYGLQLVLAGLQAAAGPLPLLAADIQWSRLPQRGRRNGTLAVLRGLLLALPLLLIFGSLFMAADAVFADAVHRLFNFRMADLTADVAMTLAWAWLAAGWLRAAGRGKGAESLAVTRPGSLTMGAIETGVVLGSLNLLFLAFVVVQFRYFFGGAALVQAATGLTYADYARRGFFELTGVTALVLPVLLIGHWLQPQPVTSDQGESPQQPPYQQASQQRLFRVLAATLLALLFVIMISAVQRMLLYQRAFGLTELRLYASALMIWLGVLFMWFAATVLRGRAKPFAFGALASGVVLLLTLHAINPNALIVRTNVGRLAAGQTFDATYVASLGADAVPALVEALPAMDPADRKAVAAQVLSCWSPPENADWRGWNWGRVQAGRAVRAGMDDLREAAQTGH